MSDRFWQDIDVKLGADADPWAIATDIEAILEAVLGNLWKSTTLARSATTRSRVRFKADDLATLKIETNHHGAPLRLIAVRASYWDGADALELSTYVWIEESGHTRSIEIDTRGPVRVEIERLGIAVDRMVTELRSRKRWAGAVLIAEPIQVSSDAEPAPKSTRTTLVRPSEGLRPTARRWFVRNRDNIIVGLSCSLIITLGVIGLQLSGVIPTPG